MVSTKVSALLYLIKLSCGLKPWSPAKLRFFILSFCRSVKESIKESAFGRRRLTSPLLSPSRTSTATSSCSPSAKARCAAVAQVRGIYPAAPQGQISVSRTESRLQPTVWRGALERTVLFATQTVTPVPTMGDFMWRKKARKKYERSEIESEQPWRS